MMTVIMVLIVVIAAIIMSKKERKPTSKESEVDGMYSTIYTPDEIFKAIGAEVKEKSENEDHTFSNYVIAYQGGYFTFTLSKNSRWMDIAYLGFERCKYEYLNKVLMVVNNLNYQFYYLLNLQQ